MQDLKAALLVTTGVQTDKFLHHSQFVSHGQDNMKIFSRIEEKLEGYNEPIFLESYDSKTSYKFLGEFDGKEFYSFDPVAVELADNSERFQVKVYDTDVAEDAEYLQHIKNKLWVVQQETQDIKSKLDMDIFTVLTNLAVGDKYTIDTLTALKKEHDDYLSNLGF
jgi:hypothetical protein